MFHSDGWGLGYGHGLGMFIWLIFIVLLIWLAIRLFSQKRSDSSGENKARDILDERFAKGEIDEQEYRRMCKELER